jgi:hypothetical protein
MVETITPVVHGGSRTRWAGAVLVHTSAATITAGAFGALLAAVGGVLGAPWESGGALVIGVAAAWAFAHEAFGVPFPVPQLRRQVPDWWRTFFSPFVSAALYGAGLGIGFFTYLLHSTFVVVSIAALASGRPLVGAAIVAPFGLARGLSAVAAIRGPGVVLALADVARRRTPLAAVHALALAVVAFASATSVSGRVAIRPLALAVVAIAFGWSAAWKALRPRAWRAVVDGYLSGRASTAVAVVVPVAEGAVAVLAVAGARRAAAALALGLLVVFTAGAVRRRLAGGVRVPCGCFGTADGSLGALLVRNVALAVVAGLALGDARSLRPPTPAASQAVPMLLSLAGVLGALAVARSVQRSIWRGRT